MIYFLASSMLPLERFIAGWAPDLSRIVTAVPFNDLSRLEGEPPGAYLFADLERATGREMKQLEDLAERAAKAPGVRILNHPKRYLQRYDFLRRLHAEGINDYQVHRPLSALWRARFPVFVRRLYDHKGPISERVNGPMQLASTLLERGGRALRRPLDHAVVEYCSCEDEEGVYRKYSVLKIGEHLIPRHILFSRNWVTKFEDLHEDAMLQEEIEYLEHCPHLDQVEEVFRLGGLDYGRIDYGLKDGRMQVWEINTNPIIVTRPGKLSPKRLGPQEQSAKTIIEVLTSLAAAD